MQTIAAIVEAWVAQRREGAVARVIAAEGLGPRPIDDMIVVDHTGRTAGTLLAGAVQPETIAAACRLLDSTAPHLVISLDVDTVDASAAGLTCGGTVEVVIHRLDVIPPILWDTLAAGKPAALVTALGSDIAPVVIQPGGATTGTLGNSGLDTLAQAEAEPLLSHPGASQARVAVGELELVIESWNPLPRLLILGASDLAVALTRQVELLGWTAITCVHADAAVAAIKELTPADMVLVIEHDPFVATPVLAAALGAGLGYVGALGSRRTQQLRREHLSDVGVRPLEIDRLRGPAGLDIGSRTPAETALSIVSEIIAVRSDRSGAPLTRTTGRISG
ncbi:MAG TPA: XdhC family protein [Ilumatobacteraceae bacterium]